MFSTAYNVSENLELYGSSSYYYNETKGGFSIAPRCCPATVTSKCRRAIPWKLWAKTARCWMQARTGQFDNRPGPEPEQLPGARCIQPQRLHAAQPDFTPSFPAVTARFSALISPILSWCWVPGASSGNSDLSWDLKGRYGENEGEVQP